MTVWDSISDRKGELLLVGWWDGWVNGLLVFLLVELVRSAFLSHNYEDLARWYNGCHSVQFSHSVMCNSLRPHEPQYARPPCPSPTPGVHPNPCPSSRRCHPTISSSVVPFSCCPHPSRHQGLFQWVSSSHQVAKVLEFQLQHQSFQWTTRTDLL